MVWRLLESAGVAAVFTEPNQSGAIGNINAGRNAPLKNPGDHLTRVDWHSDFFQYELARPIQSVQVNHPSMNGREQTIEVSIDGFLSGVVTSLRIDVWGNSGVNNHTLVNHGLGYVPLAFVAYQGRMLTTGRIVQAQSNGRYRWVSAYATSSIVGLREVRVTSSLTESSTLSSVTRSYDVLIFRIPAAVANEPMLRRTAQAVFLARRKIDTRRSYLRRVGAGDSQFDMDRGRTIDLRNGRVRVGTGGSVTTEAGYTGNHQAPPFLAVGL